MKYERESSYFELKLKKKKKGLDNTFSLTKKPILMLYKLAFNSQ